MNFTPYPRAARDKLTLNHAFQDTGLDWEGVADATVGSLDAPFEVYALARGYQGHPAGAVVVLGAAQTWIEEPPQHGHVFVFNGADRVPGPGALHAATALTTQCARCPSLIEGRHCIVEGSGPFKPLLMVIGEAPGREEDESGSPFVGQSGKLLRSVLAEVGLGGRVYYTNAVRCRPPENRDPTDLELENCRPWLQAEINRVQPQALLTVGRIAQRQLRFLYGLEEVTQDVFGQLTVPLYDGRPCYRVYHPAYILRNPRRRQLWELELKGIADVLLPGRHPPPDRPDPRHPAPGPWTEGPVDTASPWLAADTEFDEGEEDGYGTRLVSIQLSDGARAEFHRRVPGVAVHAGPAGLWAGVGSGDDPAGAPGGLGEISPPAVANGAGGQPPVQQPAMCEPAPHAAGDAQAEPPEQPALGISAPRDAERDAPLAAVLGDGGRVWCHFVKADADHLGIDLWNLSSWDDTALAAYVLRYPERGLKKLGPALTGIEMAPITGLLRERVPVKRSDMGSVGYYPADHAGKPYVFQYKRGGKLTARWFATAEERDAAYAAWKATQDAKPIKQYREVKIGFSRALEIYPDAAREYAIKDAVVTSRLARILWAELEREPALKRYYEQFEKPTVPVLADLERTGVLLDADQLVRVGDRLAQMQAEAAEQSGLAEDVIRSNAKLAQALQDAGYTWHEKTTTGKPQVDAAILVKLAGVSAREQVDPGSLLDCLLRYREHGKLRSTYVDALLGNRDRLGRVHARFNQMVTDTNRLSSSHPNLQNIPARTALGQEIRRAFVPAPGHVFVKADFSQLEVRIYAHFTREPALFAAYTHRDHDTRGPDGACAQCDVHQGVATELLIPRKRAKNVLFGAIYGADAPKLAQTAGVVGHEAKAFLDRLRQRLPSLLTWQDHIRNTLVQTGYVQTLFGWRNYYPLFFSPLPSEQRAALREAGNLPIQGTAAGILKLLFRAVQYFVQACEARLVLTVHDEVVYEVPEAAAREFAEALEVVGCEVGTPYLSVPLKLEVEIGASWAGADLKPWRTW